MKNLSIFLFFLLIFTNPLNAEMAVESSAPNFSTTDINLAEVSLEKLKGKYVVLEWFNYGCPYVRKHYDNGDMQGLQKEMVEKDVVWITINSTNTTHQDYQSLEETQKLVSELKLNSSHVLLDSDGRIGKSFGAKTTPHMFIIDPKGMEIYRGAIDDNPDVEGDPKLDKNYTREALTAALNSLPIETKETKAYGCSVKYAE